MSRRKGTGSIERTAGGLWRPRLTFGGVRLGLGSYASEAEAVEILNATRQLAYEGKIEPVGGKTLIGFGNQWMDDLERGGRRGMASLRSCWKNHVATSPFSRWNVGEITRPEVRGWERKLRGKLAPGTVRNARRVLRQCLEAAVDEGILETNPAAYRTTGKAPADAWTWLTIPEQRQLATTSSLAEEDRCFLLFLMYTGLRIGEACALRDEHVRLDGSEPEIRVVYGGVPERPTKSGRPRTVPLLPQAVEVLRRWYALRPKVCRGNEHRVVWPAWRGGFRPKTAALRDGDWKRTRQALFGRRVRLHDLRHTCAASLISGLWGKPWPLYDVGEFLGHRDVSTTQIYAHLAPSALHARVEGRGPGKIDPRLDPRPGVDPKNTNEVRGLEPISFSSPWATGSRGVSEPSSSGGSTRGLVLGALEAVRLGEAEAVTKLRDAAALVEAQRIEADPILAALGRGGVLATIEGLSLWLAADDASARLDERAP